MKNNVCKKNIINIHQLGFPINLEIIIPKDDSVRTLYEVTEGLNYSKLYETYSTEGRNPMILPETLFRIVAYGYMEGIYSSRKLEKACKRDINFRWLLQGQKEPSHNTIARFRSKRLEGCVEDLFSQFIIELEKRNEIESIVCVTAQHREMLDQVLEVFNIKPDYDLNIMKQGQTLSQITSRVLMGLEEIMKKERPNIVLVHGDTTTTFAGALAAFYNQVDIGHVEAGLRTWNKYSPFPEEMNRQMVDRMCDMYFAPTEVSKHNLLEENIAEDKIYVTGNTAIDAMKTTVKKEYNNEIFDWIGNDRMILLTAHRRENLGEPMRNIFKAVRRIVGEYPDVKVVYPIHLNPKVREVANEIFKDTDRVRLIEPLEVFDFHNFQNKSYIILTDSGGIQEEAPSLGKPVLVLRDTTERPEGIAAGTLKLVGTSEDVIYNETKKLLDDKNEYNKMSRASNPYGDGFASKYIVDAIIDKYK